MADALNGSHKSSIQPELRNVMPSVFGSKNDPLTLYLAKMSRHQLDDIMLEMKALAKRNEATAKQLLQGSPQLRKALVQAMTMLGMVTPQMMQMASSQKSHFALQDDELDLNPVTPSQGTISVVGVPLQLILQPLHSLPTIVSLPMAQPSLTHHFQPVEQPQRNPPITSLQQSLSSHPSTSQFSTEDSFLLQQLMRLTPEQLSSLPLDELQQVVEIQRILHSNPT